MPSGIVYVIADFASRAARVEAAGQASAEAVLCAFLEDFLPQIGWADLSGRPRFVACGAAQAPELSGPWRDWVQAAAATLIIFTGGSVPEATPASGTAGASSADASAAASSAGTSSGDTSSGGSERLPLAPVGLMTAERTGVIEYLTGPDAGFAHRLPVGAWSMARRPSADVGLADPFLSRQLTRLHNAPSGIHVSGPDGARRIPLGSAAELACFGSTTACFIPPGRPDAGAGPPLASAAVAPVTTAPVTTASAATAAAATVSAATAQNGTDGEAHWPRSVSVARPRAPSWLMYVAPLLVGVALAVFTSMWMFLLFSVSGPLTAGIMWLTGRRRYRREVLEACRRYRRAVRVSLRQLAASDRRHLDAAFRHRLRSGQVLLGLGPVLLPGGMKGVPHEALTAAAAPTDDPLQLLEQQQVQRHMTGGPVIGQRFYSRGERAPILVDLQQAQLRLAGDRAAVFGLLRSVLAQLINRGIPVTAGAEVIGCCPEFSAVSIGNHTEPGKAAAAPAPGTGHHSPSPGVHVATGPSGEVILKGTETNQREDWHLNLDSDGTGRLQVPLAAPTDLPRPLSARIAVTQLRAERFLQLNRSWRAPTAAWQHECTLGELLREVPDSSTAVPLGRSPAGPQLIDLFGSGPHALLAGTTGSGKSVLLQTWIAALAARFGPEAVRFVLIDFKGGAAFAPFMALAHTDTVVSNLDPTAGMRTLRSLKAEILRRERLLAGQSAADIDEFNAACSTTAPGAHLPRLVVVIDEFHALITDHPAGTEVIESITAVGRSLGIHVILATQRPAGIVTARMKANINLRLALRVRDDADSREVIDCEAAAAIPAEQPGMGFVSDGGPASPFRTATVALTSGAEVAAAPADSAEEAAAEEAAAEEAAAEVAAAAAEPATSTAATHATALHRTTVHWIELGAGSRQRDSAAAPAAQGETGLTYPAPSANADLSVAALAKASQQAAAHLPPAHRVVPDPLPEALRTSHPAELGLLDFPDDGLTTVWHYDSSRDGSIIVTGGRGSGTSATVRRCAQAIAAGGRQVVLLSTETPCLLSPVPSPTSPSPAPSPTSPSSAAAGGEPCPHLSFSHDQTWALDYLLALIDTSALDPSQLCICIDDYDAFAARHETTRRFERLTQLLTAGGPGAPLFVIAAGRRFLHSPVAAHSSTRIVFPTSDRQDSIHFGLPAGRFNGTWTNGRAVVLGPITRTQPAPENPIAGVTVQLSAGADPSHPASVPEAVAQSAAQDTRLLRAQVQKRCRAARDPEVCVLGTGPLGEDVVWNPALDGRVLTVRGDSAACQDALTHLKQNHRHLAALLDAHEADAGSAAQAAAADAVAIGLPLTAQLPYSSPLHGRAATGAQLILGVRQQAQLRALGLRELPLPPSGWAWFINDTTAVPVDVRNGETGDSVSGRPRRAA